MVTSYLPMGDHLNRYMMMLLQKLTMQYDIRMRTKISNEVIISKHSLNLLHNAMLND